MPGSSRFLENLLGRLSQVLVTAAKGEAMGHGKPD